MYGLEVLVAELRKRFGSDHYTVIVTARTHNFQSQPCLVSQRQDSAISVIDIFDRGVKGNIK
jgi:hypothetical protein